VTTERAVYFQGWFPRQHNYHPARPPRRLKMIDDLEAYRATLLVWSALGGGSISLPYLEQEAWGSIDARFRMYGFVNESEFIAAAQARGIKVSGTVFECQGWEFPAELNDDGTEFLALNEERGVGTKAWAGLREFSQDALPGVWAPFAGFFPDGLRNSDGEPVTDLLEECCSRAADGTPLHATWLECPDRNHHCLYMDRNNPVWREYLKAIVRIQIDAGVAGVQFDETETPLGALQYGGCFCKDCMKGFAAHLRALPERPAELAGEDLETFHYGRWLQERGATIEPEQSRGPLYRHFADYLMLAIRDTFAELTAYTREYAAAKGREVVISGNFYNVFPHFDALVPHVDVLVSEARTTRHRQPAWYRYAAAMGDGKPVVIVENPYGGGIVPELVAELGRGRGHDRVRLALYEGAAMGVNVSVPYGAWMGSVIEDAYYAPHELAVEAQDFIAGAELLSGRETAHELALAFSVAGTRHEMLAEVHPDGAAAVPFWAAANTIAEAGIPFDVVVLHDDYTREDDFEPALLAGYRAVVAAGCHTLTGRQRAALTEAVTVDDVLADPQVVVPEGLELATTLRRTDGGTALHVVNYAYDPERDAAVPARDCALAVRLPHDARTATLHAPGREAQPLAVHRDGDRHAVTLPELGIYAIVHFR
jgi:hypothetical protein